jgi:glycosyltransferase involved in cell wall biosynthesis
MKTITVFIPTFNEANNIRDFVAVCIGIMADKLPEYDYECLIIDNGSTDGTIDIIRELCAGNTRIKAIFNAKNYGLLNSLFYGLLQCAGDAVTVIPADFQDPPEMIVSFVREWEKGAEVVLGCKKTSKENPVMHFVRSIYYKIINKMSDVDMLEHCTDFGLFDRQFINLLRDMKDNQPYIRGAVAKFAKRIKLLDYVKQKRRTGKSKLNFYRLYDFAMVGFTSYTKVGLRLAVFIGAIIAMMSVLIGCVYLVFKLVNWNAWAGAAIPTLIGVFFLGGTQLFFIGFLGEYILAINNRLINQPLVRELERLNF